MRPLNETPRLSRPGDRGLISGSIGIPRRTFFGVAAAAVGMCGLRNGAYVRAEGTTAGKRVPNPGLFREVIMLDRVNVSVFEGCLGQRFIARSLTGGETAIDLELFDAKALESRPGLRHLGIREDPFSLMFRASAGSMAEQGTYAIDHARLGRFELFLVPVGVRKSGDPLVFQAVFG